MFLFKEKYKTTDRQTDRNRQTQYFRGRPERCFMVKQLHWQNVFLPFTVRP